MTAIVFLFLLGVAFAQKYSWNGPDGPTESRGTDPQPDNVCLTDQASCGCCLMQQQMDRLEKSFNKSLVDLQSNLEKTKHVLDNIRASRSAFSVALMDERWCLGPFHDVQPVKYKHIFLNLGDGYDVETGIFTVPRSGVYSISLTVYSDSGTPGDRLDACANLNVNGVHVAGPSERNLQDQEDSATTVMAMQLEAGDHVAVSLPIDCFLCDSKSHFNTFSGFLLYATN